MLEVIPSINAATWDEVRAQLQAISHATEWVELDITDGEYTSHKTWSNPEDLKALGDGQMKIAAHLMVRKPETLLDAWIRAGVRRIIIQWDALVPRGIAGWFAVSRAHARMRAMAAQCQANWVEFGLSLGMHSSLRQVRKLLPLCTVVQVLAGTPGPAHQGFSTRALERMARLVALRAALGLQFKAEWDIGVNPDTVEDIKKAGADIAASTSFVFNAAEPVRALEYLKNKARGLV